MSTITAALCHNLQTHSTDLVAVLESAYTECVTKHYGNMPGHKVWARPANLAYLGFAALQGTELALRIGVAILGALPAGASLAVEGCRPNPWTGTVIKVYTDHCGPAHLLQQAFKTATLVAAGLARPVVGEVCDAFPYKVDLPLIPAEKPAVSPLPAAQDSAPKDATADVERSAASTPPRPVVPPGFPSPLRVSVSLGIDMVVD